MTVKLVLVLSQRSIRRLGAVAGSGPQAAARARATAASIRMLTVGGHSVACWGER